MLKQKQYFAFEPRNYWMAYSSCIKEIQKMSKSVFLQSYKLPFQNMIVDGQNTLTKPAFINDNTHYKFEVGDKKQVVEFNITKDWPLQYKGNLDDTQYDALKNMLTKQISLIQGPPGTGKTHVGITAVKILLQNWNKWGNNKSPILVICKTNHALDQFLLRISEFENSIIRLGKRCTVQSLEKFLISKVKSPRVDEKIFKARAQMNYCFKEVVTPLNQVHKIKGFLKHYTKLNFNLIEYVCQQFLSDLEIFGVKLNDAEKNLIFDRWWRNKFDESIISELAATNAQFQNIENEQDSVKRQLLKLFYENRQDAEKQYLEKRKQNKNKKKLDLNAIEKSVNFYSSDQRDINDNEDQDIKDNIELQSIKEQLEYQDYQFDAQSFQNFIVNVGDNKGLYMEYEVYMNLKIYGYIQQHEESFSNLVNMYDRYKKSTKLSRDSKSKFYLDILKDKKIAGMTLTGAQLNMDTIRQLDYKIIILEEAGQILETHLIPLLKPGLQQIIMIGDHQQLKPSTYNRNIESRYNYNQSLLERLILNGVQYIELKTQRRMRVEFSNIIKYFYPSLNDHESVKKYPNVEGMQSNFLFLTHKENEKSMVNKQSMQNEYEAELVSNLVSYILQQKQFKSDQVTILSMYQGQCRLLRQKMNIRSLQGVRVTTVDNFQGEENEIIILSLVRSNDENEIGFLKTSNRINVGFSRAKVGFYVVGNSEIFKNQKDIWFWPCIMKYIEDGQFLDNKIRSVCSQHQRKIILEKNNEFMYQSPNGGCHQLCSKIRQKCGHECKQFCHKGSCDDQVCIMPCQKMLQCSHRCKERCSDPCGGECKEQVQKQKLECNHILKLSCSDDIGKIKCPQVVVTQFPCNHPNEYVECYRQRKAICKQQIQVRNVICKHISTVPCGLAEYYTKQQCKAIVTQICKICSHVNKVQCSDSGQKLKCQKLLAIKLPCSHEGTFACHEQKTALDQPCKQKCHQMLSCGHKCQKNCGEKCSKCDQKISYKSSCCGKLMRVSCHQYEDMKKKTIKELCVCNTNICRRHIAQKKEKGQQCNQLCGEILPCLHTCKSKCNDCLFGLFHQPCKEQVQKILICGHKEIMACSSSILFAKCSQSIQLMSCKEKANVIKCSEKMFAGKILQQFQECKLCSKEKVLNLDCNHTISYPQIYFDFQYSRETHILPTCKEARCPQQLTHHRFYNIVRDSLENTKYIEIEVQNNFALLLREFENLTKNILTQQPYPALINEILPSQQEFKNEFRMKQLQDVNKMRASLLKIIIRDFEQLLPLIERVWALKSDNLCLQTLCQAFRNIEFIYFQHIDNERLNFYSELHSKMIFLASVIIYNDKCHQTNNQELIDYASFPFYPTDNFYNDMHAQLIKTNLQPLPRDFTSILSLRTLKLKRCSNLHLNIKAVKEFCCKDGCFQQLHSYDINLDI